MTHTPKVIIGSAVAVGVLMFYGILVLENRRQAKIEACIDGVDSRYEGILSSISDNTDRLLALQVRENAVGNCYAANPAPQHSNNVTINTGAH